MYIEPNTTIKLIYDCPLDGSYENTLWFDTVAAQTTYFINTLGGHILQKNTYQRVNRGVIRVAKSADSIYDCNYMAFKNDNYLNKWFYAFIDKIDYINNVTAEITYHLDLLQTWHFAYQVEQCFVEREHSTTDEIGDNIVDEGLDTGEYVSDDMTFVEIGENQPQFNIQIWATIDRNHDPVPGGVIINSAETPYYSGLCCVDFPLTTQGINDAVSWINNIPPLYIDSIVSMNIGPAPQTDAPARPWPVEVSKSSNIQRDGGPIKNNKLYTYPYNFLYATNNQGGSAIYRYEFFGNRTQTYCDFRAFAAYSPKSTMILYPLDYKGVAVNLDERLDLSGFPQIPYNVDSFKAWLAQSASSIALTSLSTGAVAIGRDAKDMGITTGALGALAAVSGPAAAVAAGIAAVGLVLKGVIHAAMPPQAKGQTGDMTLVGLNKLRFAFMHKHITKEYATAIDDYFNMYGYACHKVKTPNISSRPEWNYVKTIGCKIRGSMPSDDAVAIEKIYDNGIRFWKNPGHIGNYTFDNSPVVVPDNPNVP